MGAVNGCCWRFQMNNWPPSMSILEAGLDILPLLLNPAGTSGTVRNLHPNRKAKRHVTSSAVFDVSDSIADVLTQGFFRKIGEVWCAHTNIRYPHVSLHIPCEQKILPKSRARFDSNNLGMGTALFLRILISEDRH